MRRFAVRHTVPLVLLSLSMALPTQSAPRKPSALKGKLVRTLDNRVTVFYEYKTKDGKYHKAAAVSQTVLVKVFKPSKPSTP